MDISDLTAFDASETGQITLIVKKDGYFETTFTIDVVA